MGTIGYITYFEPFGDRKINTSKEVALSLDTPLTKISLPVSWKRSQPILNKIMDDNPRYLFMLGEAGSYQDVTIETKAHNICLGSDEDGEKKNNVPILKATSKILKTNFEFDKTKFPVSEDAGKFLCNYVYYIALLKTEVTKIIFIHIPYFHNLGTREKATIVKKVENIINDLMSTNSDYLIKLNRKCVSLSEQSTYKFYPSLKKEYNLGNVIIGIDKKDENNVLVSGRVDGLNETRYLNCHADEINDSVKKLYYYLAVFQLELSENDKENKYRSLVKSFSMEEYYGLDKRMKILFNFFVSRADYNDEISFYKSLDRIESNVLKSVINEQAIERITLTKDFVCRLGLECCRNILLKSVK